MRTLVIAFAAIHAQKSISMLLWNVFFVAKKHPFPGQPSLSKTRLIQVHAVDVARNINLLNLGPKMKSSRKATPATREFLFDDGSTRLILVPGELGLHLELKQKIGQTGKVEHHFLFQNSERFDEFIENSPLRFDSPHVFLMLKRASSEMFESIPFSTN